MTRGIGTRLVETLLGAAAIDAVATLDLEPLLDGRDGAGVDRVVLAAALNVVLFAGLVAEVPDAATYVAERRGQGHRIRFDHGALRTIRFPDGPTGALPPGEAAFTRILLPLGYEQVGTYPLPRLRMTGRAYAHRDAPNHMPQFFLSELHVDAFDDAFAAAAHAVFDDSTDPLGADARAGLGRLGAGEALSFDMAAAVLADCVAAFGRRHSAPYLRDYETLAARSAEAAWIATEGNRFNHATDRVPDVAALAVRERAAGRPIKDRVEVSTSGRVRQTAYRAAPVRRPFRDDAGEMVTRTVPGSFYEFITRDVDPATGRVDLAFDSGNATGIFAMTRSDPAT